jgi:hypothetical protein
MNLYVLMSKAIIICAAVIRCHQIICLRFTIFPFDIHIVQSIITKKKKKIIYPFTTTKEIKLKEQGGERTHIVPAIRVLI